MAEQDSAAPPEVLLRAEGLGKSYGAAVAVAGVDLEVRRGEVTGLVGRNGAGKTTLLRMLAGALLPTEGRVWRTAGLRAGLAMDRDVALYSDMPVGAYLSCMARLGPSGADGPGPDEAADWLGLADRRRQEIRTLSRGYRQRVLLAQALLGAPDLILLDEPLNSLDPVQIAEVSTLLRSLPWGPAVVVSSHVVAHVLDLVDDVAVMSSGALVARGPLAGFFGPHGDGAVPAVTLAVAAAEADVRSALEPAFRLDEVATRGGVTRAVVRPGPAGPAGVSADALAADVLRRLAAQGLPVVEAQPRRLLLTEYV